MHVLIINDDDTASLMGTQVATDCYDSIVRLKLLNCLRTLSPPYYCLRAGHQHPHRRGSYTNTR
jgi:hypothetical protein